MEDEHATLITYTGNVHNMLKLPSDLPRDLSSTLAAPMATYLRDLKPVSINLRSVGGTAWAMDEQGRPGVQALPMPVLHDTQLETIHWSSDAAQASYSGDMFLPAAQPSIPAAFMLDTGRDMR